MPTTPPPNYRAEFQCAICLDLLVKPVQLHDCSHTFCTICLHTFVEAGGLACPECRTVIKVPPSAVSLSMERALHSLMSAYDTPEEVQRQTKREQEASTVSTDVLWKRIAKQPRYDAEDDLFFCTICHHEIDDRDGYCTKCNEFYPAAIREQPEEEEDEEDDDDDDDDDDEDYEP